MSHCCDTESGSYGRVHVGPSIYVVCVFDCAATCLQIYACLLPACLNFHAPEHLTPTPLFQTHVQHYPQALAMATPPTALNSGSVRMDERPVKAAAHKARASTQPPVSACPTAAVPTAVPRASCPVVTAEVEEEDPLPALTRPTLKTGSSSSTGTSLIRSFPALPPTSSTRLHACAHPTPPKVGQAYTLFLPLPPLSLLRVPSLGRAVAMLFCYHLLHSPCCTPRPTLDRAVMMLSY